MSLHLHESQATTFFTVADENYFTGVALLVNSLRLTGNAGEVVVLDIGLSSSQRERLEPHLRVATASDEIRATPALLKPYPHLFDPSGTVVLIDSDMIVTRSLDPILEQARGGKICLFPDLDNRWMPEWEALLGLAHPPRRQPYLNAGFIAFSTESHPGLLRRYWEVCSRIPSESTRWLGADYDEPLWNADQDAINALLMSEVATEDVLQLPEEESPSPAWPGHGSLGRVRIDDARTLRCSLGTRSPYLLHYWGGPKPWHRQAWTRVERNAYVELMPRLLFADDVTVPVDPSEVPPWVRPGRVATAVRAGLAIGNRGARRLLKPVPPASRERLAGIARKLAG